MLADQPSFLVLNKILICKLTPSPQPTVLGSDQQSESLPDATSCDKLSAFSEPTILGRVQQPKLPHAMSCNKLPPFPQPNVLDRLLQPQLPRAISCDKLSPFPQTTLLSTIGRVQQQQNYHVTPAPCNAAFPTPSLSGCSFCVLASVCQAKRLPLSYCLSKSVSLSEYLLSICL